MNYIAQCLEKFRQLPEATKNILGSLETLVIIKRLEERYNIPLSFLVVLVATSEISLDDVPEYVEKKYGFSEEDAFDLRSDLTREIFSLLIINTEEDTVSSQEIKDKFNKGVVALLNNDGEAAKVNQSVFGLLSKDGSFQEELSKVLLNNQEKLINDRLTLEDREVPPTIANWLKDFIKTNGSEMFNELTLAQYLSNSANAKSLNPASKNMLRKLLKLYRNLTFFPESMDNLALEDWQIIPFDPKKESPHVFVDALGEKKSPVATKIEKKETGKIIKENVNPNKEVNPLTELQQTLAQYTPGSLEYKAVAQEIERLKKKK